MLGEQAISPRPSWAKHNDELAAMSWTDVTGAASSSPLQVPSRHRSHLFRRDAFEDEKEAHDAHMEHAEHAFLHEPKVEEKMEDDDDDSIARFPDTHQGRLASMFSEQIPCTGIDGPTLRPDGSLYMHEMDPGGGGTGGGGATAMSSDESIYTHQGVASLDGASSAGASSGYFLPPPMEMQPMEDQTSVDLQQLFPSATSHQHGADMHTSDHELNRHFSDEYQPLPHHTAAHMMVPFPFGPTPSAFDEPDDLSMQDAAGTYSSLMTPPTAITIPRTTIVSPMNGFGPPRMSMMLPPSLHELKHESLATAFDDDAATGTKFSPDRRKLCCVDECKSQARAFNRCKRHGGSKRCSHPGCTKSVQSRGLCIRHGGGSRCQEEGCTRAAQSHGKCKMHGGGRPCVVPGCEKKAHLKRLCRKHGGGAKCSLAECDKWAQRQGMCMTHSKHQHPHQYQHSMQATPPPPPSPPLDRPARAFFLHNTSI